MSRPAHRPRPTSVYQQAMGADFQALQPELQEYFSLTPGSGFYGLGTGRFDVVGCPQRWLRPLLALSAAEEAFFPEYGENIPFEVQNHAHADPFGRPSLTTVRTIQFPAADRIFQDTTSLTPRGLVDYLGRRRRLATDLHPEVGPGRSLRAISTSSRFFGGNLRLGLPGGLDATAYMEQKWDPASNQHRIQVKVLHRVLGVLLVYSGGFDYRLVPYPRHEAAAHGVPDSLPLQVRPDRWEPRV